MSPDDTIRLKHMLEAAELAIQFAQSHARAELNTNAMLRLAMTRAVEIVGEAAARLSEAGRLEAQDIPWAAMVGMRNRLVHAYFDVDNDILWATVTRSLPPLAAALKALLHPE
jgi:uncharacterized protein with HEPN domain